MYIYKFHLYKSNTHTCTNMHTYTFTYSSSSSLELQMQINLHNIHMTLYDAMCVVETFTIFHCHVRIGKVPNAALQ